MKSPSVLLPALAAAMLAAASAAAEPEVFRISLNTGPNHVRNIAMEKFIALLKERAAGRLQVELYPSGQLFKGPDVPKALAQGTLEMGAPIILYVSRIVPNAGITDMPMFYGRGADEVHAVFDGDLGRELNAEIESRLKVKIIGRYLDLGHASHFTVDRPLNRLDDLSGLKLRVAGSAAAQERFKMLGAQPVSIKFGDVPLALAQGAIDGLMTSHETVRSAKLWESGLRYALDDYQVFFQYIPMIGQTTWDKLDADVRQTIIGAWDETIDGARALAARRQASARAEGVANGIRAVVASEDDLRAFRKKLAAAQDAMIADAGIDPDFAARAAAALGE